MDQTRKNAPLERGVSSKCGGDNQTTYDANNTRPPPTRQYPTTPQPHTLRDVSDHRDLADEIIRVESTRLNAAELEFLQSITQTETLTPTQQVWLHHLACTVPFRMLYDKWVKHW